MPGRKNILKMLEEAVELYEIDTNPENFEELVFEYKKLLRQDKENSWARADLAAVAGQTYGKLKLLAEETGDSHAYLRQLSYVSSQYDRSMRRQFDSLTFSHFRAVAHLPERYLWLQRAQTDGWTVDKLRAAVGKTKKDGYISINKIVSILNKQPHNWTRNLDAMTFINTALSPVGKLKWTGKKFVVEELY